MTTRAAHTAGTQSQRWNTTAQQLGRSEQWCTCCERPLEGRAIRMLELDQRDNTYHDFCDVPENKSQGWFPFGLTCAAKLVRAAAEARANG